MSTLVKKVTETVTALVAKLVARVRKVVSSRAACCRGGSASNVVNIKSAKKARAVAAAKRPRTSKK